MIGKTQSVNPFKLAPQGAQGLQAPGFSGIQGAGHAPKAAATGLSAEDGLSGFTPPAINLQSNSPMGGMSFNGATVGKRLNISG